MTKRDDQQRDALDMRQRAEALAREAAARETEAPAGLSPEELQEMLHELRVHQIQLELQNEELRRAQEEIGAARARYFDLYDLAPVGYCTLSEEGLILEANLKLATLLGLDRGALVDQPVSRFVIKEDQDIYYLHRKQLFEMGEPQECELRLVRPDGAPFWAQLKGTAARAQDGAPLCRVIISDVTERKRAEEELRSSSSRQESLIAAVPDIIMEVDVGKKYRWANPVGLDFFGEDVVGKEASSYFDGEQNVYDTVSPLFHGDEQVIYVESWQRRKDGQRRLLAWWCRTLEDGQGNVTGTLSTARDITERKRAEERVRSSEALLSRSQEISHTGSWKLDLTTNRLTWSDEVYRIFGCKPQEFAATFEAFLDFVHPDDRAAVDEAYSHSLREGSDGHEIEHRIVRRSSGEVRYVHERCVHERDDAGAIIQSTGMVQEITERKRAETALRESEERFRITLESIGDAVISTDLEGRVALMNPVAEALTGWSTAEARGRPLDEVFRIVNEQTRATVESPVARVLRDRQIVGLANHTLLIDRQGAARPIADSGAPIRDEQGQISGVVLVFRDQTEERRHEAALIAEHENLRAIVDGTPAAVFIVDEAEIVVTANPEAERLFGLTGHELDGTQRCGDLAECLHCHDDPRGCGFGPSCPICEVNGALKQALGGHAIRNREVSLEVQHNGRSARRFFVMGAAPVTTRTGRGAALALQDITALREALAERERLHASLAQSDRLSTMGTLAAGVAHEINNPLSYVLYNIESLSEDVPKLAEVMRRCHAALCSHVDADAMTELLGAGADSFRPAMFDDVVARFHDALAGTIRIKEIARGLGTFSRVEGSEVVPVNLHDAAEQAINLASNQIKYRARLVKDFGQVPFVLGSDGKLAQVFLNLLINAAHAIDEGYVEHNEIRIRTWAEGETVFAEVSDTGKGIAPEHQARLFEPFFTTKDVGVGSGLGLSISRNIVTGFGGELSFSSEPGKGTRFLIRLPRPPREWQTRDASMQEDARPRSTPRGRILVVDDERGVRAIITRMLGRDHEVVTAASGEEARAILEQDRCFDLIFCDLMMPRISGMELHAWLVERDAALAAQVVFMTGGAFTPGASEYLARVSNLRVEKPFDTMAFKTLTDELILAARAKIDRPA